MTEAKQYKAPIFETLDTSPQLLDRHADFLSAGGDRLLSAMQDTIQPGLWPWDKPAEHTAQYGAFCSGVAWACTILRKLNIMANNRRELSDMVASALSAATDSDRLKETLIREYGYTEADFKTKE